MQAALDRTQAMKEELNLKREQAAKMEEQVAKMRESFIMDTVEKLNLRAEESKEQVTRCSHTTRLGRVLWLSLSRRHARSARFTRIASKLTLILWRREGQRWPRL